MNGAENKTIGIVKEKAVDFLKEDAGFGIVIIVTVGVALFIAVMDIIL